jgi:hypothetical protein
VHDPPQPERKLRAGWCAGAPQGVDCTVQELLDGDCLDSLEAYITQNVGSYTAS